MTSGKPTVTGGNRKQSEFIPTIPPEEPEDRHCYVDITPEPFVNTTEKAIPEPVDYGENARSKLTQARTFCFIVHVVYLLTLNFKFSPIITSLLNSPPLFAFRWRSERELSPF